MTTLEGSHRLRWWGAISDSRRNRHRPISLAGYAISTDNALVRTYRTLWAYGRPLGDRLESALRDHSREVALRELAKNTANLEDVAIRP
jgi:hypothetical protein